MVLKRPIRSLTIALRYWRPTQLSLIPHPYAPYKGFRHCYAWLWWNFLGRMVYEKEKRVGDDRRTKDGTIEGRRFIDYYLLPERSGKDRRR